MCGIVGLHPKNAELHPRLGKLLVPMLVAVSSRGPDSTGVAVHDGDAMEVVKDVGRPAEISARGRTRGDCRWIRRLVGGARCWFASARRLYNFDALSHQRY